MALYVAACPDCFGDGLHQLSMFFKPVVLEAVAIDVVAFFEAKTAFDHRVWRYLREVRRNCLMASPPGLEPGITA